MNWCGKSDSRTNRKMVEGEGTLDQHVENVILSLKGEESQPLLFHFIADASLRST